MGVFTVLPNVFHQNNGYYWDRSSYSSDTPLDSDAHEEQLPPLNGKSENHVATQVNGKTSPLVAGARKRKLRGAKIQQVKRPPADSYLSSDGMDHMSGDEQEAAMTLHNFAMRIHPDKVHICTTCGKGLSSASSLERHLLVHTGEKPFKCSSCDLSFSTNGNMHRHMRSHAHREHADNDGSDCNDVHSPRKKLLRDGKRCTENGGFNDLSFVDFSAGKFPLIAKEFCEHYEGARGANAFSCDKCNKVFPCKSALSIHDTGKHQNGENGNFCCICESAFITSEDLKLHMKRHRSVEEVSGSEDTDVEQRKDDFLGLLDLQKTDDESDVEKVTNNNNSGDFADIQSILSMTSKTAFLMAKSPTNATVNSPGSHTSSTQPSSPFSSEMLQSDGDRAEEEDAFAAEFREMKLRGEFPCRLCSAVYPNLRALKGHNRTHLGSAPYRCNMCPFVSNDKNTVIRHMRIHNGDRPFECSICKYAFTTKANCERHLRNRHNKRGREEVRESIIFHPQDSASGSESSEMDHSSPRKEPMSNGYNKSYQCKLCELSFNSYSAMARHGTTEHPTYEKEDIINKMKPESTYDETEETPQVTPVEALVNLTNQHNNLANLIIPKVLHPRIETPLDLTVNDVLDLSKKRPLQDEPEDLSNKKLNGVTERTEPVVKRHPPYFQSTPLFYTSPFQSRQVPLYFPLAAAPGMFNNSIPPMFPLTLQSLKKEETPQKTEDLKGVSSRGLQLSTGGGLLTELPVNTSNAVPKQEFPTQSFTLHYPQSESSTPEAKSPSPSEDPATMKMVIKNGVLMKKQKQRRYRTERPFACDFCSARFTLRSNMERHIKQQHPDNWSRRPRGTRRSTPIGEYSPQSMNIPDVVISEPPQDIIRIPSPKLIPTISDEVRQQLKQKLINEPTKEEIMDCSERLVIDEAAPVKEEVIEKKVVKEEVDLASVKRLLDDANTNTQNFQHFFSHSVEPDEKNVPVTVNKIKKEPQENDEKPQKKKSAYSSAPHKVSCPYCLRKFPWTSSLHRHILTHTGQKPFKCPKCNLWFTTKSNRDRHLLRKHRNNSTDSNFNMRNVPERPYKCPQCPSSTFSTLSNLKKHQASRHMDHQNGALSPSMQEDEDYNNGSYEEEENENGMFPCHKCTQVFTSQSRLAGHIEQHSELPFKCHLCDDSFSEREEALDHIKSTHEDEYTLLVSKGALDTAASAIDDYYQTNGVNGHQNNGGENGGLQSDDAYGEIRGKFPDYTNRKVTCAFCMRRFWSAEDLRRHMRTHSGVRPFTCTICQRKFTLKHSMLRHKKKHDNGTINTDDSNNGVDNSDDENESINGDDSGNSDCEIPVTTAPSNGILLKKKRDNLTAKINKISAAALSQWDKDKLLPNTQDSGDLISNLLGFANKDIVDELICKSADDAAKLLGVQNKV